MFNISIRKCSVILLLWMFPTHSNEYRILAILPVALKSHFNFNNALILSLASAGHHATIYSPFPQRNSSLLTYIDTEAPSVTAEVNFVKQLGLSNALKLMSEYEKKLCHYMYNRSDIKHLLNSNEKYYDILITELLTVHCFQPLAAKMQIPVIGTMTYLSWPEADRLIGNPNNPSYIPFLYGSAGLNMNFFQRLQNVCGHLVYYYHLYFVDTDLIYDQYFIEMKRERRNIEHASLVFSNSHPAIIPRPSVPNLIQVGGLHVKAPKKLPKEIETFIDDSKAGVIVVSFGSSIIGNSLDTKVIDSFKEAFSKIPQRVIWKFEGPMDNVSSNILLMEWMPQTDILAHKNVKAFISHCGLSGIYEAISFGIPIIAVPVGIDQESNGAILEDLGVAIRLNFDEIQADNVLHAVNSIINETRYAEKMQVLSHVLQDRIMSLQETVVYWTEYVIRHNGALHLQSTATDLYWFQYLLLDVIIFIIVIISVTIILILYCLKKLFRLLCRSTTCQQNKGKIS